MYEDNPTQISGVRLTLSAGLYAEVDAILERLMAEAEVVTRTTGQWSIVLDAGIRALKAEADSPSAPQPVTELVRGILREPQTRRRGVRVIMPKRVVTRGGGGHAQAPSDAQHVSPDAQLREAWEAEGVRVNAARDKERDDLIASIKSLHAQGKIDAATEKTMLSRAYDKYMGQHVDYWDENGFDRWLARQPKQPDAGAWAAD